MYLLKSAVLATVLNITVFNHVFSIYCFIQSFGKYNMDTPGELTHPSQEGKDNEGNTVKSG